jgi:hypothetical protein
MKIDLDLKVKLFKEYLDNGGYEKIHFLELRNGLQKVKSLPNGKVDPSTVNSEVRAALNAYLGSQVMPPFMSDKHISYYETLLQKSLFFDQTNIETKDEFDEVFEKYNNAKGFLFRGLNEAKYRLYSSLQRDWISTKEYTKDRPYNDFLKLLVENARKQQQEVLSNYLVSTGFDPKK